MIILLLFQRVDTGHECCLEPDVFVAKTEKLAVRKAVKYLLTLDDDQIQDNVADLRKLTTVVELGDWLYENYDQLDCYSRPHR